jgi:DNA repair photolyase
MGHYLKGRGALSNPPNRFAATQVAAVDDGWSVHEVPDSIATHVRPERARTIIMTNQSPDIPFEQSINPYRGCEHGCPYCAAGDTLILMADGRTRPLADLRVGDEIYGTRRDGWYRRYTKTRVLAHWSTIKPAFRTTLEDGTTLVTSGDHRFLTERGWKYVMDDDSGAQRPHLTRNNKLMGVGAFARAAPDNDDYRRGYLSGMIRGDGREGAVHQFRPALCDDEALYRIRTYLSGFDVATREFQFARAIGSHRALNAIRTHSLSNVETIRGLIAWPLIVSEDWSAGFLAGIFDAEGSYSQTQLQISNTDLEIIDWISKSLRALKFSFVATHYPYVERKSITVIRVRGGLKDHLRFFHIVRPAISRKLDFEGQAVKGDARLQVVSIEPFPAMRLYDITTGTEDFIANGVVSHNCYARPSHAYMDLSPGLDFETHLFYKADAAELLRQELGKRGYVCKPITVGANTDPYQPLEKRLRVTRSILEVLRDTRHPVTIITKGSLITRDLDLLAELARDGLVNVLVTVTTLDNDTKRLLEPRAAAPSARLRIIRQLTECGVNVGVLVAPVIPAITEHELEQVLAAAAQAGARHAGYVILRLPHELKILFREWLETHYPARAAHVMSIIHSLRGGRDNDPRFGSRMRGEGPFAQLLRQRFQLACARYGLARGAMAPLPTTSFRPPPANRGQLDMGF